MKQFIDIQVARLEKTGMVESNVATFVPGDHVLIEEKVDGSNASITYDQEEGKFHFYSRTRELLQPGDLHGFYDLARAMSLHPAFQKAFQEHPNYILFGEWDLCCNALKDYLEEHRRTWIVYDLFDKEKKCWLPFEEVKAFFELIKDVPGIELIHVLYDGPFLSWDHVATFLHQDTYGPSQEGVVIKDQDKLFSEDVRQPFYLKIVNESFKETKAHPMRTPSPQDKAEREKAERVASEIVTERRVEKALERLRDAGVIPESLTPKDMGLIAKNLPKAVYEDCVKEEPEAVKEAWPAFGRAANAKTMGYARKIILGQ